MKYKTYQINIEIFAITFILALFTLSSLFLVVIGASVYKNIIDDTAVNSSLRASLFYVTNKIRTAATGETIIIDKINNIETLKILETYPSSSDDGTVDSYITYLYYHDGGLYELFSLEKDDFNPENGEKIVDIASFNFEKRDNLLIISAQIENDGKQVETTVKLK